jgi:hypothetical protein
VTSAKKTREVKPLDGWSATVETYVLPGYHTRTGEVLPQPMALVRLWRAVAHKRKPELLARVFDGPMNLGAWRALEAVLVSAGLVVEESVRT